jgi:phosphoribosylanthranilate isomerase
LQRVRVKICGITRIADMQAAARLGADAIGLVFYPPSPRVVSIEQAADICDATPAFVSRVGLFVNPTYDDVCEVLDQVPLDILQFHGDEPAVFCRRFGRSYMKALRMKSDLDVIAAAEQYDDACGLLLDSHVPGVPGGTGTTFDWQRIPASLSRPLILAGGLDPANVSDAIRIARPWAVDVSGGVEQIDPDGRRHPGIKSEAAMAAFIEGVHRV